MQRPDGKSIGPKLFSKIRLAVIGLGVLASLGLGTVAAGEASAAGTSHAQIFSALEELTFCGIAAHVPGSPREVLCSNPNIPAPKNVSSKVGDPGFVYPGKTGKPKTARLSQYSWQAEALANRPLLTGGKWSSGQVGVTCAITKTSVRCTNRSGHGFSLTAHSYIAF